MFRKLWSALANLTAAVDTLTASVKEANANFRANLQLNYHDEPEPEQLTHEPAGEPELSTNSRRRKRAKA